MLFALSFLSFCVLQCCLLFAVYVVCGVVGVVCIVLYFCALSDYTELLCRLTCYRFQIVFVLSFILLCVP